MVKRKNELYDRDDSAKALNDIWDALDSIEYICKDTQNWEDDEWTKGRVRELVDQLSNFVGEIDNSAWDLDR